MVFFSFEFDSFCQEMIEIPFQIELNLRCIPYIKQVL